MKNYYDELEVSKTASKEVIEKVYKTLAKKYHPDITNETNKQAAEEKFKNISEAYEILSDDEKRRKYDIELEESNPTVSYEQYMELIRENDSLTNAYNNLRNEFYSFTNTTTNYANQNLNNNNNQYNAHYNNKYNTSNKKEYYYTDTGEKASAFSYYIYKIKKFFSNLFFLITVIIAIIIVIKNIFSLNTSIF